MKKETKVVCPICGAEIAIGEHEHQVKNATVIGKDSGLGTIELPLERRKSKAQICIEQLKSRGIDTSKMFAMVDNNGDEKIGVQEKNGFKIVDMDENIERILNGGTISASHLFKQHVLAQMLRLLTNSVWDKDKQCYTIVRDKSGYYDLSGGRYCSDIMYDYTWTVLNDELMRQSAMYRHGDMKSFIEDNRWYNYELAVKMAEEYRAYLFLLLSRMKVRKYKRMMYIKYKGADALMKNKKSKRGYLYTSEFGDFIKAVDSYISEIKKSSDNPISLHKAVANFCKIRPTLCYPKKEGEPLCIKRCKDWDNAYKGYGAYFSMQNLILFHDCKIHIGDRILDKKGSMKVLDLWASQYKNEAYWLIGALKQLLRDNKFDIEAKRKEWAERYL